MAQYATSKLSSNRDALRELDASLGQEWSLAPVLTHEPLPDAVAEVIRSMIRGGRLTPGEKLPSEFELAARLRVSRGTLRSAMHLLQEQGLVWRRQGIGTFVSAKPFLHNRLDLYASLTDLVASTGRKPGIRDLEAKVLPATEHIAQNLQTAVGSPLVWIRRTRTADDVPVIASIDYFPLSHLGDGPDAMSLYELCDRLRQVTSLQRLFAEDLGLYPDHAITAIRPVKVDRKLLSELHLPVLTGSVLLCLEQTDYDRSQRPLVTGYEYHVPEFCDCTIYRHR
jgi:GntR family transcriptional regulator